MPATAPTPSALEIRRLDAELSRMAALVETQLQNAITAFERRDIATAESLIANDARIDEYDRDIETKIMNAIAGQNLTLEAVHEATTIMKLSGELERVGDLAKNVAKRTLVISREAPARPTLGVIRMGRASLRQFSDVLNAYARRNLDAALAVWRADDELDELYNSVFQEILAAMMQDPLCVNACTHLVFSAKNFERVGDHATNIAEIIHFLVAGSPIMNERPKGDETATTVVAPPKSSGAAN